MAGPYTDHHVHFLATAAARLSVDVSSARSLAELAGMLGAAAGSGSGWMRAWGYEEWRLIEGRHPTREELDGMVPRRPVVLHHRTGHAAVLNSPALAEVGAAVDGDGLLVDRHDLLSRVPRLEPQALRAAAATLSSEWEAAGVGSFVDATHTNGLGELDLFDQWRRSGELRQSVTAMIAPEAVAAGPLYGEQVGAVRIGAVKLMPGPGGADRLEAQVVAAHGAGFPVAVHVVEIDVLEATLRALASSPSPAGTADRIEHNALCLPEQVDAIAAVGATVVVNPSFLLHRRGKYEAELTPLERSWLIRMGSLLRAGVVVRAGSDSPVTPSRPDEMLAGAQAHPFQADESVSRSQAAAMLTAELP